MRCISVCIEDWDPTDQVFDRLVNFLDDDARVRIRAYRFRNDALASLVGKLLPLWEMCCSNQEPRLLLSIQQARESKGRPYLVRKAMGQGSSIMLTILISPKVDATTKFALDYDFNISHDGGAVAMISQISPGRLKLGIDIMRVALPLGIPSIPEFEATVEDMLSNREKDELMLAPLPDKLGLLLRYWTSKEAISKASGEGLSFPYAELDSTSIRQAGGNSLVQGKLCALSEIVCNLGSHKYMVCIAALQPEPDTALPAAIKVLPIQQLVKDMLALETTSGAID